MEQINLSSVARDIAKRVAEEYERITHFACDFRNVGVSFTPVGARTTFRAAITVSGDLALYGRPELVSKIAERVWLEEQKKHPDLFDPETRRQQVAEMQLERAHDMGDDELTAALARLRGGE